MNPLRLFEVDLVDVTPFPRFTGLEGLHDRVAGLMKMFGGMLVLRRIAAAHVTTLKADSQMYLGVARLQGLFAAFRGGLHVTNLAHMFANRRHRCSFESVIFRRSYVNENGASPDSISARSVHRQAGRRRANRDFEGRAAIAI